MEDGVLRWDLHTLWAEVQAGLGLLDAGNTPIASIGVDTWGVDYGLLDPDGRLVDTPTCYRDPRNVRAMKHAVDTIGAETLYDATGVQLIAINTIFSLLADIQEKPGRLASATKLLMMPDVFHHLLSGSTATEYTAASTSGLFDMQSGRWSENLLTRLGIPLDLMPEVLPPGTDVGPLLGKYTGSLRGSRVILPAAHDTASAVVGAPLSDPTAMFISSGTWSLVGVETAHAVVTGKSRHANLTNEGGYGGTIRLLRNVMGLWILQNCRRQWTEEGLDLTYAEIAALAEHEPGLESVINPDAEDFLAPGDMPRRIQDYCHQMGIPVPHGVGAIARCVIDSLALSYRCVAEAVTEVTGIAPCAINIVGGGASHALLSQLTADATGLPVHCGPVEATALGNAAVQLAALGELDGLADIRKVIAASTDLVEYRPWVRHDWDSAAARLARLGAEGLAGAGPTIASSNPHET